METASPDRSTRFPVMATAGSAALFGAAFWALAPSGESFVELVWAAFRRSALEGVLTVLGFGSPFLFGLSAAVGPRVTDPGTARRIVLVPLSLMHSQLVLVAIAIWSTGDAIAPWSLLGFALVGPWVLARQSAHTRASSDPDEGAALRWTVRWGAVVVAAIAAWTELQRLGGARLGPALEVALVGSLAMIWSLRVAPRRAVDDVPA